MNRILGRIVPCTLAVAAAAALPAAASAATVEVAGHWTPERIARAQERDVVVDAGGLAYLRSGAGVLRPYGHDRPAMVRKVRTPADAALGASAPATNGRVASGDTIGPLISGRDPADGATIGADHTFRATVTDASGVRSVAFVLVYPDGRTSSYAAGRTAADEWTVSLAGMWDGSWSWRVVARDGAKRGGNTTTSATTGFTVDVGGGTAPPPSVITDSPWTSGGAVQSAAGRIYFEMPANSRATKWSGYVCSGTVVTDARTDASIVLTAAHCVYDDVNKAFARNVMFIPDQAATTASGTDRVCSNDRLGCWAADHGVVDADWASRSWPDNIPWDYGYYVLAPAGFQPGYANAAQSSLETAAGSLPVQFTAPTPGDPAAALGYSYSDDPKLMFCTEGLGQTGTSNWWLSQCGLSGGSSGGPWLQPLTAGNGPIVSVNSWGYTSQPGMAGPKLSGSSAQCLMNAAEADALSPIARGVVPAGC